MDIEAGNISRLDTNYTGWFIGFSDWAKLNQPGRPDLRFMPKDGLARTLHAKWMTHPAGDPRGTAKPPSEGRTISILVSESGLFHLEFCTEPDFPPDRTSRYTLTSHGDFVIWGEGLHHRWSVDRESTIMTFRWIPVAGAATASAS